MARGAVVDPRAYRWVFFAWLVVVTTLLLAPEDVLAGLVGDSTMADATVTVPAADKLVHAALFAGLGLLALPAFPGRGPVRVLGALVAYALVTELVQGLVPGRAPDAWDFVADALGLALAAAGRAWFAAKR